MSFVVKDTSYDISEFDVNTNTGQTSTKGPITLTGLQSGTVVLAAQFDSTLPGWRLLIANPK